MFGNFDSVIETLVHKVLHLAMVANKYSRKKSPQALSICKACVAYAHITIPSLKSDKNRITLFLQTSRVALCNGLIAETESII